MDQLVHKNYGVQLVQLESDSTKFKAAGEDLEECPSNFNKAISLSSVIPKSSLTAFWNHNSINPFIEGVTTSQS